MKAIKQLNEVLESLRKEHAELANAIAIIERAVESLAKRQDPSVSAVSAPRQKESPALAANKKTLANASLTSLAATVLAMHGKPMNIKDLTFEVSQAKGRAVTRASLEGTLFRHIKSAKDEARVVKVAPGFYALPAWPRDTRQLWSDKAISA